MSVKWRQVPGLKHLGDVTVHRGVSATGTPEPWLRIALNRPEVRNAFRPQTVDELMLAFEYARAEPEVGCVILTGNGPSAKDGGYSFCSGGDQNYRGLHGYGYVPAGGEDADAHPADCCQSRTHGYSSGGFAKQGHSIQAEHLSPPARYASEANATEQPQQLQAKYPGGSAQKPVCSQCGAEADTPGAYSVQEQARNSRLHILWVQQLMRSLPKVVVGLVDGWAAGGGHSLAVCCDLLVACREHAKFKQTDAKVASFDAGYGSTLLARKVGDAKAREIFFLAATYDAVQAEQWGLVNQTAGHEEVEDLAISVAQQICSNSPQAIRMLKYAFNLADDGLAGQQLFAGEATRLAYNSQEAQEGRDAFLEKRAPNWRNFPYYY